MISLLSAGRTPWTRTGRRENERHRRPPLAPLTPHLPDRATLPLVTLFDTLYAFFQEQQYCGDLDGGVEGDRVWMTCTCGAVINRNADRD